jgi:hypothetical protein
VIPRRTTSEYGCLPSQRRSAPMTARTPRKRPSWFLNRRHWIPFIPPLTAHVPGGVEARLEPGGAPESSKPGARRRIGSRGQASGMFWTVRPCDPGFALLPVPRRV